MVGVVSNDDFNHVESMHCGVIQLANTVTYNNVVFSVAALHTSSCIKHCNMRIKQFLYHIFSVLVVQLKLYKVGQKSEPHMLYT